MKVQLLNEAINDSISVNIKREKHNGETARTAEIEYGCRQQFGTVDVFMDEEGNWGIQVDVPNSANASRRIMAEYIVGDDKQKANNTFDRIVDNIEDVDEKFLKRLGFTIY